MDHVPPGRATEAMDGVFLTQMAVGEGMSIQHLRMDPGAVIPNHSHHHEQVGFVYQGEQTFVLEDDVTVTVGAGESYALAGDEPHGAQNRGEEVMLAVDVFCPPRPNPDWLD